MIQRKSCWNHEETFMTNSEAGRMNSMYICFYCLLIVAVTKVCVVTFILIGILVFFNSTRRSLCQYPLSIESDTFSGSRFSMAKWVVYAVADVVVHMYVFIMRLDHITLNLTNFMFFDSIFYFLLFHFLPMSF